MKTTTVSHSLPLAFTHSTSLPAWHRAPGFCFRREAASGRSSTPIGRNAGSPFASSTSGGGWTGGVGTYGGGMRGKASGNVPPSSSSSSSSSSSPGLEDLADLHLYPWGSLPTQVAVAAGVASFWRGAWYVMDGAVFPDNLAASGAASLAMGVGGIAAIQRFVATKAGLWTSDSTNRKESCLNSIPTPGTSSSTQA